MDDSSCVQHTFLQNLKLYVTDNIVLSRPHPLRRSHPHVASLFFRNQWSESGNEAAVGRTLHVAKFLVQRPMRGGSTRDRCQTDEFWEILRDVVLACDLPFLRHWQQELHKKHHRFTM